MPCAWSDLTPRQQDVARCIGHGLANRACAEKLSISWHTVKNHRTILARRLSITPAPGPSVGQALYRHILTKWPWCAPGYMAPRVPPKEIILYG